MKEKKKEELGSPATPRRPILVVEDDGALRELIVRTLRRNGYEVFAVDRAKEARMKVRSSPSWVLLLDEALPDMKGSDLLQELEREGLSQPFIVMTGQGDERFAVEMMRLGASDYLTKDTELLSRLPGAIARLLREVEQARLLQQAQESLRNSEQYLSMLISNTPAVIYSYFVLPSGKMQLTYVNDNVEAILGYTPSDFIKNMERWHILVHPSDREMVAQKLTGLETHTEYRIRDRKGNYHWIHDEQKISSKTPEKTEVVGIWWDITDRKTMEQALFKSEEKYRKIFENIQDVVYQLDENGIITEISPSVERYWGFSRSRLLGRPVTDIYWDPKDRVKFLAALEEKGELKDYELTLRSPENTPIVVSASAQFRSDAYGQVIGVEGVLHDITERKKAEARIEYLSFHDSLTGLYNRRFFDEALLRLDTEENLPLTLMILDVNGLKLTNDAFGHAKGDELLKKVAEVVKNACKATDVIARIGGDEFVVLLPKSDLSQGRKRQRDLTKAFLVEKIEGFPLSVSVGVRTKTSSEEEIVGLFKQAEDEMYREKLSSRTNHRYEALEVILKTLYDKAPGEEDHAKRAGDLCRLIGEALELEESFVKDLVSAARFHDIGKIAISERILNKDTPLSDLDWQELKRHPEVGYTILSSIIHYAPLAEWVLAHHERWDGRGYPKGLKGEEIPLAGRILLLACAYDAMLRDTPYRKGLSEQAALLELENGAHAQFDPRLVRVFVGLQEKKREDRL